MRRPPAVARVLERVTRTAREHEMFRPGDVVLVCVSGGPDSVCLLYSLWHLRRLFRIRLEVFHFDHRLRPDSAMDGAYVARLAERLRMPFHLRSSDDAPATGVSIEAWATGARTKAADDVCRAIGAQTIAEGHTLDDQAETVLMNLIRGGGLEAVGGIWPGGTRHGRSALAQPLLDVERAEVEAFCRALHLRPRVDPTNRDTRQLRNAVRLRVIPAIERATGREIKRPIARSADLLREDRWELDASAVHAFEQVVSGPPEELRFDVAGLLALPRTYRHPGRPPGPVSDHGAGRPGALDAGGGGIDPGSRPGPSRPASGPPERIDGETRAGVCFPLSHFPREPGVKGGEMEGRVALSELENNVHAPSVDAAADARERDIERILITEQQIQDKLRELGEQITRDYEGRELLLLGVLKGAFVMMADLSRHIRIPLEVDFMAVASYGAATKTSGVVRILKDLDHDLEGRHVLLIEDIVDSGLTLNYLLKNLRGRRPASLEVCALLKKTGIQRVHLDVKYVGFEIPPDFVVGYGLDFAERFRNLPYVGLLKPEAYTDV